VELHNADGTLLQTLSEASIHCLQELGWTPPEEFVVTAADGETDLYGIIYKPYDFDSNTRYPVIESNYPVVSVPRTFVPLDWAGALRAQALAQLGFVVFIVDTRGSGVRGKKFQDVIYRNWGRHEIPDHVAALRQVAETRRYMDLSRVGIFGHSWGGYFTIRAMLLAPELYRVGVASAPIVDVGCCARAHEPWMGLPQNNRDGYEYASNLHLAGNLEGELLLITGTNDVLFSEAMKMVDALIRAEKPYDLVVLPEQGHGYVGKAGTYVQEATRRYFQEHLKP
jgi:dipeptidyl aminopeptidase/acylaminoacyl peptidase